MSTPPDTDFAALRALFDELSDLPDAARKARMDELNTRPELRERVLAMLADESGNTTHFSKPVVGMLNSAGRPELQAGDRLGAWTLVAELGHGGMGQVFEAQRSDGHYQQRAAIKLLRGWGSEASLALLARERQILASLQHPHIARLIDGGTTPRGRPYLVMDFVDGQPIDVFVKEGALKLAEVLSLFEGVCEAVGYAHRQLVVHCDIKPANVLVGADGRAMLLDFGIAQLPGQDEAGSQALTPRYASPEQLAGKPAGPASDIYSLGRLLAELLALVQPPAPRADEWRAITERASAADPEQRYLTVQALLADLRRFRQHLPLAAHPATPAYRLQKLVRRRWPWVLAGSAGLVLSALFTVRLVSERDRATDAEAQARQAQSEAQAAERRALDDRDLARQARADAVLDRDRAAAERDNASAAERSADQQRSVALQERNRARGAEARAVDERNKATDAEAASRQVSDFMISVFNSSDPNAASGDIPASTLLAQAEARLGTELARRPAVQAELYNTLGVVQKNMGAQARAVSLFERAIEIEREQGRPLELAKMLFQLADVRYISSNALLAVAPAQEALAIREKLLPADSREVGQSLSQAGQMLSVTGNRTVGGPMMLSGLAVLERADPASHPTAYALANVSVHHFMSGDLEQAESTIRRALAIRVKINGDEHPLTVKVREDTGFVLNTRRKFSEAEALLRLCVETRTRLHGRENLRTARAIDWLSQAIAGQDRIAEALPLAREVLATLDKTGGRNSVNYHLSLLSLGQLQFRSADYPAASASFTEAMAHLRRHLSPKQDAYLSGVGWLGRAQMGEGRMDEARANLQEALNLASTHRNDTAKETADARLNLAEWHLRARQPTEAAALLAALAPALPFADKPRADRYVLLQGQLQRPGAR